MAHSSQRVALLISVRDEADAANVRLVDALRATVKAINTQDVRKGLVITAVSGAGKSMSLQVSPDLSPAGAIETALAVYDIAVSLDDGIMSNAALEVLMRADPGMKEIPEQYSYQRSLRC